MLAAASKFSHGDGVASGGAASGGEEVVAEAAEMVAEMETEIRDISDHHRTTQAVEPVSIFLNCSKFFSPQEL